MEAYGGHSLVGWPTWDGIVPYKMFILMFNRLSAVHAHRQLAMHDAVALALQGAFGGKEPAELARLRRDLYGEETDGGG